jgi:hypothetical protein
MPDNEDAPYNHLAALNCENNSTSSLHWDQSQFDGLEDLDSLQGDDNDAQSQSSGLDSVEDTISLKSGDESQECVGQVVRVFCLLKNVPDLD